MICDERVLEAIAEVPREAFVPEGLRARAWEDVALPIDAGQTISQPTVVAKMCELLELSGEELVLDVGTGSGYHAAVLSRLARRVISIERHIELSLGARRTLSDAGITNVELITGDGTLGHPAAAPYDSINVAAAAAGTIPHALEEQLADGGRLVVPLDARGGQRLVLVRRRGERIERRDSGRVRFVPLISNEGAQRTAGS